MEGKVWVELVRTNNYFTALCIGCNAVRRYVKMKAVFFALYGLLSMQPYDFTSAMFDGMGREF